MLYSKRTNELKKKWLESHYTKLRHNVVFEDALFELDLAKEHEREARECFDHAKELYKRAKEKSIDKLKRFGEERKKQRQLNMRGGVNWELYNSSVEIDILKTQLSIPTETIPNGHFQLSMDELKRRMPTDIMMNIYTFLSHDIFIDILEKRWKPILLLNQLNSWSLKCLYHSFMISPYFEAITSGSQIKLGGIYKRDDSITKIKYFVQMLKISRPDMAYRLLKNMSILRKVSMGRKYRTNIIHTKYKI